MVISYWREGKLLGYIPAEALPSAVEVLSNKSEFNLEVIGCMVDAGNGERIFEIHRTKLL